jgi:hypothetical protein
MKMMNKKMNKMKVNKRRKLRRKKNRKILKKTKKIHFTRLNSLKVSISLKTDA